jgi:DNA polymerase III delta prime subunit
VDSLTIDLAREIKEWTEGMPQYRTNKLLVLAPTIFPHVSQNTLLKTFEEPSGNTQIILVVKESSILLPTILSRAVTYSIASEQKKYGDALLRLFLKILLVRYSRLLILKKRGGKQ